MVTRPLQIHPWTVLGVGRDASPEEIRAAFREKSKKHHPDLGGDEWAFRMVQHAYDTLISGADDSIPLTEPPLWTEPASEPWRERVTEPWIGEYTQPEKSTEPPADTVNHETSEAESSWLTHVWPTAVRWFHPIRIHRSGGTRRSTSSSTKTGPRIHRPSTAEDSRGRSPNPEALLSLRTIEIELVWIRFTQETDVVTSLTTRPPGGDDSTLSVCMVVSWPPPSVVDSAAEYPESTKTLRTVIAAFESLKHGAGPTASQSKIEAGRFVGWLSYTDVPNAEAAFKRFRERISGQGLSIRLQTRQERLPFQWQRGAGSQTTEPQASRHRSHFPS